MMGFDIENDKLEELLEVESSMFFVASDSIDRANVKEIGMKLGWELLYEKEENEVHPYILCFRDPEKNTEIYYREENLDILKTRYFHVNGVDIDNTISTISKSFPIIEGKDLLKSCKSINSEVERCCAVYKLGIAYAGKEYSLEIEDIIKTMSEDKSPNVRQAVIYAIIWLGWQQLQKVLNPLTFDSDNGIKLSVEKAYKFLIGGNVSIVNKRLASEGNLSPQVKKLCEDAYAKEMSGKTGYEKALTLYNEAIILQGECSDIFCKRATLKWRLEDYSGAIEDCNRALELDRDNPQIYMQRARMKWFAGHNLETVIEDVNTAIGLDPRLKKAFYCIELARSLEEKANILYKEKRYIETFEYYKEAIRLCKDSEVEVMLNNRACKLISNGHIEKAILDLNRALNKNPKYAFAMLTMAEAYVAARDHDKAIDWLEKAVMANVSYEMEIDKYSCYHPLRNNPRYKRLISGETRIDNLKKIDIPKFYIMEISLLPGSRREYILAFSKDLSEIEKVMQAHIKGALGFYKLLCYGQNIMVHKIEVGKRVSSLNMLPFISLKVPNMLTAVFDKAGEVDIRDTEGRPLPKEWTIKVKKMHKKTGTTFEVDKTVKLGEEMWEYCAFDEKEETLFIEAYEEKLNKEGEGLLNAYEENLIKTSIEQVIRGERNLETVCEIEESRFDLSIDQFVEMMKNERI